MSKPSTPTVMHPSGCMNSPNGLSHLAITTQHENFTRLESFDERRVHCPACGAAFVVPDRVYGEALLADAAYLREQAGDRPDTECAETGADVPYAQWRATADEWERRARILAPDPRQVGLGFGERS